MGEMIQLTASDGVKIHAYKATPAGKPRGGIVVLQEIFGVNHHIRAVADLYAAAGYLAIAPATFDRVQQGVELGYDAAGMATGMGLVGKVDQAKTLLDVAAAIVAATSAGKVGVVGYCWGGTVAFASACHLAHVAASVGYYGGGACAMAGDKPQCPTIMHFGETDHSISMADVEKFKAARPETPVYVYPAGHGFNCDERGSWHAESAELARNRTLEHFAKNL